MKKMYLIVNADYNDADYISSRCEITPQQLEKIMPVIEALKEKKRKDKETESIYHSSSNWETGELAGDSTPQKLYVDTGILTEEQVNMFNNYVPSDPDGFGVHTIESIEIVHEGEKLF